MHRETYFGVAILSSVAYAVWLVVYRLVFHPLARFPGPKIAAATKWYEAYFDLIKAPGGQYSAEINRLHDIYGPIIRINPDELHVKDSSWFETLYCNASHGTRDKYEPSAKMTGTPKGIFGTVFHDVHRKRRSAISHFFSKKTVDNIEPMIQEIVGRLSQRFGHAATSNSALDLRTDYLATTTDIVCKHTFKRDLGLLRSREDAQGWKATIYAIATLTPLAKQFTWIIPTALKMPMGLLRVLVPSLARIVQLNHNMHTEAGIAIEDFSTRKNVPVPKPQEKADLDATRQQRTLFQSCLGSNLLSAEEKKLERLAQEAFTIIVAGSETAARVLTTATFYMITYKEQILSRLREELRSITPDISANLDLKALEKLPWLTAIIKESLRINALVTSRLPLIAPDQVLHYGDWMIPAGTPISMTLRDILLDEEIFDHPNEFRPERWLVENPDLARINRFYLPFGRGSRMCIGVNLAMAELYIILGTVFRRFELDLYDTTKERDIDIARDCFIGEPSKQSPGVRVKVTPVQDLEL